MKRIFLGILAILVIVYSCNKKKVLQGSITYDIQYRLPDSLGRYALYLPKSATVYFKGDSAVSIQQMNDEATTVITCKPTNFMRVLLRSSSQKFVIDYNKADQQEEEPAKLGYAYTKNNKDTVVAGHRAIKYTLVDKATGEQSEVWFTKEIRVIPNSLTMAFDTTYGFPLAFSVMQNGMLTKTTVKNIRFEPVPDGIFSTPAGYQKITPKQLRDMPVDR
ncbi:MAG: hypothetical protein JST19_02065 [Bacteroidetes bacterium]|nr:hypothetical protein [Bacteroidota bacterium]